MHPHQSLKRKERELEHEMERLAKEKVAQQKRMLILRREIAAHNGQDPSFFMSDNEVASLGVGGNLRERCKCPCLLSAIASVLILVIISTVSSESLSDPSPPNSTGRPRYSSTSSMSSAATASSPCAGFPVSPTDTQSLESLFKIFFLAESISINHFVCDTEEVANALHLDQSHHLVAQRLQQRFLVTVRRLLIIPQLIGFATATAAPSIGTSRHQQPEDHARPHPERLRFGTTVQAFDRRPADCDQLHNR